MYALCVSGAVNTQGFVWKFFMRYIYIFIHSFRQLKNEEACGHPYKLKSVTPWAPLQKGASSFEIPTGTFSRSVTLWEPLQKGASSLELRTGFFFLF